jgi:hypothetical protein
MSSSSAAVAAAALLLQSKLPIMAAGTLNPGDYQWPFSFQLPHNVPGSFNYTSGSTK